MNLTQLKANLSANLGGESATDLHTADDRLRALNQAYQDISLDLEIGEIKVTLPILVGATYEIPSGFTVTDEGVVDAVTGLKLARVAKEDIESLRAKNPGVTGQPLYYAINNDNIVHTIEFFPQGSAHALTVGTIMQVGNFASESVEPWAGRHPEFHNLIPLRAAHILYREKGLDEAAMRASRFWLSEYDREKERLARKIRRESDGPTVFGVRLPSTRRRHRRDWDE